VAFAFCVLHSSKWISVSYLLGKILHQHPLCCIWLSEGCKGRGIGVGDAKKSVKKEVKTGQGGKGGEEWREDRKEGIGIHKKCDCWIQTMYDRGRDARGRGEGQEDRYIGLVWRSRGSLNWCRATRGAVWKDEVHADGYSSVTRRHRISGSGMCKGCGGSQVPGYWLWGAKVLGRGVR
jgi:hypothetical protein